MKIIILLFLLILLSPGCDWLKGDRGSEGLAGGVGPSGIPGLTGDKGDAGGDKGDKGDKGDAGSDLTSDDVVFIFKSFEDAHKSPDIEACRKLAMLVVTVVDPTTQEISQKCYDPTK